MFSRKSILTTACLFSILIGTLLIQGIFFLVLKISANRIGIATHQSLNIEMDSSDFDDAASLFKNLENTGLIRCTKLDLIALDGTFPIYKSPPLKQNCSPNHLLLQGLSYNTLLKSIDGRTWSANYVVNFGQEMTYLLWLTRVLLITALVTSFIFINNWLKQEAIIKKRIDLHIKGIAHDLRSPISAIRIFIHKKESLNDPYKISLLKKAIERVVEISEEILTKRRDISNLDKFLPQATIKAIVEEKVASMVNLKIASDSLNQLNDEIAVFGNRLEFQRLISNIIDNSYETTALNELTQIDISATICSKNLTLCISDNGPGFPANILDSLGNKPINSAKLRGSGIGLLLAKKDITKWGGKIYFSNSTTHSAKITIQLPLAKK